MIGSLQFLAGFILASNHELSLQNFENSVGGLYSVGRSFVPLPIHSFNNTRAGAPSPSLIFKGRHTSS